MEDKNEKCFSYKILQKQIVYKLPLSIKTFYTLHGALLSLLRPD